MDEELVLRIGGESTGGQQAVQQIVDAFKGLGGDAQGLSERLVHAFEQPLDTLKSLGDSFKTNLLGSMGSLGEVAAGTVAVLGTVAVGLEELGQHATETAAELQKVSLTTGIAVPALGDLKFALEATGGSLEQLNNVMFMFEQRMVNSSDKVDTGLKMIGLSLDAIAGMSHDQQILAISEAMQSAGDDTNKAAAAMDIFGRSGRTILPQLMQPLGELAQKSKELGGITAEAAEAAHKFEIAHKTMAAETSIAWTQLGLAVAPITNEISLGFDRMKLAVANVALTVADVVTGFGWFHAAWQTFVHDSDELPEVSKSVKGLADGSGLAAKGLEDWANGIHTYTGSATSLDAALETQSEILRDLDPETQKAIDNTKKHAEAMDKYRAVVTGTVQADADHVAVLAQLLPGLVAGEATYIRVRDAIAGMLDKGEVVPEMLQNWYEMNRPVLVATQEFSGYLGELGDRSSDAADSMYNLASSENQFSGGITVAGDELDHVTIPLFTTLAREVLPDATNQIAAATRETVTFAETLGGALSQALTSMPNVLVKALTGPGGLAAAVSSLGSKFGADLGRSMLGQEGEGGLADTLTSHFGETIGGALGAAIPAVGALVGPLLSKLFSLGGPSHEELQGRDAEGKFEASMGGIAGIGKALTDAGLSADAANAKILALFAAERQGGTAVQSVITNINGVIQQHAAAAATDVGAILDAAKMVGTNFPAAMQPVVAQLAALPGLTDDEKDSLLGLVNAGQPSFSDLTAAAGRYGLSLDSIGGKAAQLSISHEADQIESDYKTLVITSGADSDKVLAGMKDSLTKLVNHALDAGAVLPTALKPLVDQLFNTGQLTDDAGNKITDLSKLKFDDTGDPLATGMKSLTDAINHLGDLLSPAGLPKTAADAAAAIGSALGGIKAPQIDLHYRYIADNAAPDLQPIPMAAGGIGRVTRPTLFLAGEAGDEDVAFSGGGKRFGTGLSGGVTIHAPITVQGNVLAEEELYERVGQHLADVILQTGGSIPLSR